MSNYAVMSHILVDERVFQFLTSSKRKSIMNVAVNGGAVLFGRCTNKLILFSARHLY